MRTEKRREQDREYYKKNRERVLEVQRAYSLAHLDKKREYDRARYIANPEKKRQQARERARNNPEENRERSRAWCEAHPERYKEVSHRWNVANAKKKREKDLLKNYGLTVAQFLEMSDSQGGVCAICGDGPREKHPLHVDHDHATGKVRALLCWHCNAMLGIAKDNPEILRTAADYLERFFSANGSLSEVV